jgi:N-acetylmuramoyl-L-alanine amidase
LRFNISSLSANASGKKRDSGRKFSSTPGLSTGRDFWKKSPMKRLPPVFRLAATLLLLASCAAPSARHSTGRDEWGHRPGPKGFRTVILDAGHGGSDPGAVSRHTGQCEKELTLDMARRIRGELGAGFRTILMRSDDTFIDLDERVARANRHGDAILVSIHFNSGPSNIRGPETYYWRVDSHGLAVRIQNAMSAASPAEHGNRGLVRRRLRLTRNPEIPCVLLEGGYLSHPAESRLIADPAYRQKLASAIARAIRSQAAIGDAGTGPLPRPIYAPPSRPTDAPE